MRVMGVDPGFGGGLALLEDGELRGVTDMPVTAVERDRKRRLVDVLALRAVVVMWKPDLAVIERVGAAPGQGVASMFRFGYGAGEIHGLMVGLGVRCVLTPATVWKPALRLPGGVAGKAEARAVAGALWPGMANAFKRTRDDGRAEAALLAHWGVLAGLGVAKQAKAVAE